MTSAHELCQSKYEEAQRQFQAASTGMMVTESGEDKTHAQDLMEKKRFITTGEAEIKQMTLKLKHLKSAIAEKKKKLQGMGKASEVDKQVERILKQVQQLEEQLKTIDFDAQKEEEIKKQLEEANRSFHECDKVVENLLPSLGHMKFNYKDPMKNFDHSRVKGMVGTLVSVKDKDGVTALEVGAGGSLYQVVVDSDQTGKLLLQKGQLQRRVTMIPLNTVSSRPISSDKENLAQSKMGPGESARVAIRLVDFDEELSPAMQFVFGRFFVCSDAQAAKKITFDSNIQARSVTLEGDVYDPSGTLSGGSRKKASNSILTQLSVLNEAKTQAEAQRKAVAALQDELKSIQRNRKQYMDTRKQLDLAQHQANLLKERQDQSEHQCLLTEIAELESSMAEMEQGIEKKKAEIASAKKRVTELEYEMKAETQNKEGVIKSAEKKVKEAKKAVADASKGFKAAQQDLQKIRYEISEAEKEKEELQKQEGALQEALEIQRKEVEGMQEELKKVKGEAKEKSRSLEEKKKEFNRSMTTFEKSKSKLEQHIADTVVSIQKTDHAINAFQKEQRDAQYVVSEIEKEHEWVSSEKTHFNRPKSDYDFGSKNIPETRKRVKILQEQETKLAGTINRKVKDMFETAEQKYKTLRKRIDIIESDKESIHRVIEDLDKKKNEALENTYEKVNRDMGKIFETLLPGAVAKLEAVQGGTILDGLEVKVAFGGVWKESLSELSGGQRSLLALSLILALLLFKPAPMYVLDEIDAALDLSHTQNIGQIIRTHFSKSQFIIVSLKEGMFSNANVLFRVKGVNGISNVTRYQSKGGKSAEAITNENSNEKQSTRKGRK